MTDASVAALHRALLGNNPTNPKPSTPAFDGPQMVTIVAGGTPAGVRFTVDAYGADWAFGPAPFHRPAPGQVPPAGTKGVAHFTPDGQVSYVLLFNWP